MRRVLFILLLCVIHCCDAQEPAELFPFIKKGKIGWINNKGDIVIQPEFYSKRLLYFKESMCRLKTKGNKYYFIDEKGQKITSVLFDEANDFCEGLALVKINGLYGFINKNGEYTINPEFTYGHSFSEGLAAVRNDEGLMGFINKEGKYEITPQYIDAGDFHEELAAVKNQSGFYGYINKKDEYVIMPTYEKAEAFDNGYAIIKVADNKYGIIDDKGTIVIPPLYNKIHPFTDGVAGMKVSPKTSGSYFYPNFDIWELQKQDGAILKVDKEIFHYFGFSEGVAYIDEVVDKTYNITRPRYCYYIDTEGHIIIDYFLNDQYCIIDGKNFSEGLASVELYDLQKKKSAGYGYINKKGEIVISPQFDYADSFIKDLALVIIGKHIGYIDKKGNLIFKFKMK